MLAVSGREGVEGDAGTRAGPGGEAPGWTAPRAAPPAGLGQGAPPSHSTVLCSLRSLGGAAAQQARRPAEAWVRRHRRWSGGWGENHAQDTAEGSRCGRAGLDRGREVSCSGSQLGTTASAWPRGGRDWHRPRPEAGAGGTLQRLQLSIGGLVQPLRPVWPRVWLRDRPCG